MMLLSKSNLVTGILTVMLLIIISVFSISCAKTSKEKKLRQESPFIEKLLPAIKGGGFEMPDYWIWGASVIKGEDGLYHMFADRWAKDLGFQAWVTASEVVHAVSEKPEGPYRFVDVALPKRGAEYFDGLVTHNPRVIKYEGTYYLYYFGTTYDFPTPKPGEQWGADYFERAWMNKRVGIAWSNDLNGPWNRSDRPAIEPRPNEWDASITTNPSPIINPNTGKVLLIYKSSRESSAPPLLLGVAEADSPLGEYIRLSDDPIFRFDSDNDTDNDVEDPFVWHNGQHYELIMKDRFGHVCGEDGAGVHAVSENGVDWELTPEIKAYSRTIIWNDGTTTHQANLERPFLLIEDGKPTYFFAATGEGDSPWNFNSTWNMVIPLKQD